MALTATGIGSGLKINEIVQVLVDAEKSRKKRCLIKRKTALKQRFLPWEL